MGDRYPDMLKKCIGEKVWLVMREDREFTGVLSGYDDFMSTG